MRKQIRILSIDGGGIRGILPGQILVVLEKKLQEKSNNPNARIADYFDMIAGTSTGGILTCLYLCPDENNPARPKYSAQEAVNLYLENGNTVFTDDIRYKLFSMGGLTDEKYSSETLEKLLKKYFNEKKLSQLLRPCIIPSYNIFSRSTHFFTQHDAKEKPAFDYLISDVALATSSAPTYFEPARIYSLDGVSYPLVDGGVFANNPAMCAYAEARQQFKHEDDSKNVTGKDLFIVSVGTGLQKRPYDYEKTKGWGPLGWVLPALDVILSAASETVDFQLKQIFDAIDCSENYFRINPDLGQADPEMDNASAENMQALKEAGIAAAEKDNAKLERIADFLVKGSV